MLQSNHLLHAYAHKTPLFECSNPVRCMGNGPWAMCNLSCCAFCPFVQMFSVMLMLFYVLFHFLRSSCVHQFTHISDLIFYFVRSVKYIFKFFEIYKQFRFDRSLVLLLCSFFEIHCTMNEFFGFCVFLSEILCATLKIN